MAYYQQVFYMPLNVNTLLNEIVLLSK